MRLADSGVIPVVMTKPKEKDGITKYHVNRRACVFSPLLYWVTSNLTSISSPFLWTY